jgi:iron complex transport system substrate-binding protein
MLRIVSLVPAATEILVELGLEEALVAAEGQSLESLQPDLVITEAPCPICSPDSAEVPPPDIGTRLSLRSGNLAEVFASIATIARACDVSERAEPLVRRLRRRIDLVRRATTPFGRKRALVLESFDPLVPAGHWVPELIEAAGGQPVFDSPHPTPLSTSAIIEAEPEILVLTQRGSDLAPTHANCGELLRTLAAVPAVRAGRVFVADGIVLFNRPGLQLATAAEVLAAAIHPGSVDEPNRSLLCLLRG